MNKQGKVHIYYGMGKGKTSALNGMAIRALGYDWNIKYLRFFKSRQSGEIIFFNNMSNPKFKLESFYSSSDKFIWDMNEAERKVMKTEMLLGIKQFKKDLSNPLIDILICDEIIDCIVNKFISEEELIEIIKTKLPSIELVMSGHYISQELMDIADLVSEIKSTKHYFDKGLNGREGIEW